MADRAYISGFVVRKAWGTGSVRPHKGGWRVRFSFGSDASGRRLQREWFFKGDSAEGRANAKYREVSARLTRGLSAEESRTPLSVYAGEWLAAIEDTVKPSTFAFYRSMIGYIGELEHMPVETLSPMDVRGLIASMRRSGKSSRTIRGAVDVLRMVLRMAMNDQVIDRNVAELVDLPKLTQKEPVHFTADQARQFLESIKGDPLYSLFAVALGTGLRRSELLALTWRDVDLEAGTIKVRQSKTEAGVRTWMLPDYPAIEALSALERKPGPIWHADPSHVSHRMAALCERAGVPRLTFHQLRHTAASLMLDEGVDPFLIQQMLGHTRLTQTQRYSKADLAVRKAAADRLGGTLRGLVAG